MALLARYNQAQVDEKFSHISVQWQHLNGNAIKTLVADANCYFKSTPDTLVSKDGLTEYLEWEIGNMLANGCYNSNYQCVKEVVKLANMIDVIEDRFATYLPDTLYSQADVEAWVKSDVSLYNYWKGDILGDLVECAGEDEDTATKQEILKYLSDRLRQTIATGNDPDNDLIETAHYIGRLQELYTLLDSNLEE